MAHRITLPRLMPGEDVQVWADRLVDQLQRAFDDLVDQPMSAAVLGQTFANLPVSPDPAADGLPPGPYMNGDVPCLFRG